MIIDNMIGEKWGYFFVFINSTKWIESELKL